MAEYKYEYLLFEYYSNTELFAHLCFTTQLIQNDWLGAKFATMMLHFNLCVVSSFTHLASFESLKSVARFKARVQVTNPDGHLHFQNGSVLQL